MTWEIIPVVLVIALVILFLATQAKKYGWRKAKYDERQMMIRMKSYMYANETMIVCALAYMSIGFFIKKPLTAPGIEALIIALIGVAVFTIYSIFHDAFFSLDKTGPGGAMSPLSYIILLVGIVAMNAIATVESIRSHELLKDGILTHRAIHPVFAVLFLVILISIGIKYFMNARESRGAEQ